MFKKLILKPDHTNKGILYNHISSKLLIPLGFTGIYLNNSNQNKKLTYLTNELIATTFAIHSYISTSNIITDYVKPKLISKPLRFTSLGLHSIALIGYSYYFLKNIDK